MRRAISTGLAGAGRPALALLVVGLVARLLLAVARVPVLGGHAAARQAAAGVWQDLALAGVFGLVAGLPLALAAGRAASIRRAAAGLVWAAYAAVALWLALNVPAALLLGGPLTWPMLAGAGAALGDSVAMVLSWSRILGLVIVLTAAALSPRWLGSRPPEKLTVLLLAVLVLAGLLGSRLAPPPGGGHRNAVVALVTTAWRAGGAAAATQCSRRGDLRALPAEGPSGDLRDLEGRAKGRNIVWVVLESTGAAYLRPYGAAEDPMPRLTRLAEGGIVFEQAYTVYPESVKGLYSLLCSRETAAYKTAADYAARRRPCHDLAAVLRDAGYATALYHSGRFAYLGMHDIVADRGFDRLLDAGDIGGPYVSSFGTDDGSTVERILSDLDQRTPDRPFFLMLLPIAGHHPYESPGQGPRPFGEADNFRRYLSDLAMGDAALGRLVDGLDARGLGGNTLWILSGDHGEAFEQHPGNVVHSLFIYEENVRVPLIIAAPGLTDSGGLPRRAPQIASVIDIAPTALALLGIAAPDGWRGRSLLPPRAGSARFYTDHTTWQEGLRQDHWKYILDHDRGSGQLFDLRADPGELSDVAARYPERAARYRAVLEAGGEP